MKKKEAWKMGLYLIFGYGFVALGILIATINYIDKPFVTVAVLIAECAIALWMNRELNKLLKRAEE